MWGLACAVGLLPSVGYAVHVVRYVYVLGGGVGGGVLWLGVIVVDIHGIIRGL